MGKRLGALLLGGVLAAAPINGHFSRMKDGFKKAEAAVDAGSTSQKDIAGGYVCTIGEQDLMKVEISPNYKVYQPYSGRSYPILLDVAWGDSSHQTISLKSDDSYFNDKTLEFAYSNTGETSYQKYSTAFEGAQLGIETGAFPSAGPILVRSMHMLTANTHRQKEGSCQAIKVDTPLSGNATSVDAGIATAVTKAVFIRPQLGDFYASYGDRKSKGTTTVGCDVPPCTVDDVSQDLLASGVTDVFIAFKTDGSAWTLGSHDGDLAYASLKYPSNIDPIIRNAIEKGFDPIMVLMKSLQSAYSAVNKTINIHAWFPVFSDWYAAQIQPQTGTITSSGLQLPKLPIIGQVKPYTLPGVGQVLEDIDPQKICYSDTGAEPSNPQVVKYLLNLLTEIHNLYPSLYGINLDYIRYKCSKDKGVFCYTTKDAKTPVTVPYTWNINTQAIDDFVNKVNAQFSDKVISADLRIDSASRAILGQADVPHIVKIAMPMVYTDGSTLSKDASDIKYWITDLRNNGSSKVIFPIVRSFLPATVDLITTVTSDIQTVKSMNVSGFAIFNYESLLTETGNRKLSKMISRKILTGW